jgi:hypothetical protein
MRALGRVKSRRLRPRGASLTWADARRLSGKRPRAADIAGGSACRELLRLVSATTRLPLYRLAYHRYGRARRA